MKDFLNRILGRERTIVGFKIFVVRTTAKGCTLRLWKRYKNGEIMKYGHDLNLSKGDTLTLRGKERDEQENL